MAAKNLANEIYITRIYDAPVKAVWDAWTDAEKVAKWWGPRGFTITTHSKDLKTGGHWDYTMHGPDDTNYPNVTKYLEVAENSKLVYDHGSDGKSPPLFRVTVVFTEEAGKTKMDMTMTLPNAETARETEKFIRQAGGNSTWDRLAEYIAKEKSNKEMFVINRTFDAPINLVFDAWTNPDHFSKWIAPKGFTTTFFRADIKTGGSTFYKMASSGTTMYGKAEYRKVERPTTLIYTQSFCDENENLSRHPLAPTWPATMITHVTFAEEAPNKTRVTVEWEVYGDVPAEEMETFIQGRTGMTMGWTGSFDKLEEYLKEIGNDVPKKASAG